MSFSVWIEIAFEIETKIAEQKSNLIRTKNFYINKTIFEIFYSELYELEGLGMSTFHYQFFFDNHPNDYRSWIVG